MMKAHSLRSYTLYRRFLFLLTFLVSGTFALHAQIETAGGNLPPYDPQTLIEDILLGEGVEILNITYEGEDAAVGYFNNGTAAVGIEEGIVLTTGVVATDGANLGIVEPGSVVASANNNSTATDPDVDFYAEGQPVENVAKYEITFVPSSDRLSFRYVFASDEYPEFSCTQYNDFFGFFISGPGFSGAFENNSENIALIPGTNLPVTINNIHPANPSQPGCTPAFIEFFNDNDGSSDFPIYDGILDVFTAEAEVVPCETYTIKLVISDIGDAIRDSGVFFEARSFSSDGFEVSANSQSLDGSLVEGCTDGSFVITIAEPAPSDIVLDYQMIGDAVNGVDYQAITGNIVIPAGSTSVSVPVIPNVDGAAENTESIGFDIQINNCTRDTFYLYLRDEELATPDLGLDTVICSGNSYALDGTVNIGNTQTQTFNSTAPSTVILGPIAGNPPVPAFMDIEVSGFNPPELREGLIQSVCMNIEHSAVEDLDVYLFAPGGQFILLTSDNGGTGDNYTNTCFTPTATQSITLGMAEAPASAAPFTGDFLPEGNWESLWFDDSPVNGTWRLMVIDDEQGFTGAIQDWAITFNSTYDVSYSWSPATGLSCTDCPNPTATPAATETYVLTVEDTYGCTTTDEILITVIDDYAAPEVMCMNVSTDEITFGWNDVPNANGYEVNVDNGGWFVPNNGPNSHIVSGLSTGTTVSIEVRATGDCPALIGTESCQTIDCGTFNINTNAEATSCVGAADGVINISSSGPNGAHTYTLAGASNTMGVFEDLSADTYEIVISDDVGCAETISVMVPDAPAITSSIVINNNIDCDNDTGSATVTGGGGTEVFLYSWSNGDSGNTLTANAIGEYFVTITDGNMCTMIDSVEIISEGSLEATVASNTICPGSTDGEAVVTVTEGAEPITYQWDSNAANQDTETASNLTAGNYSVTVTSADNCELVLLATVGAFPEMTLMTSSVDAGCGAADGSASVAVSGVSGNLTYLWSDDNAQTTATATGLAGGEYFVTVTDENMCTETANVFVNTPSSIEELTLTTTPVTCFDGSDGTVSFTAQGGTPPLMYSFMMSTPQATGDFTGIPAGEHVIVVTDGMDCTASFPFTITQPDALETTPVVINDIDCANPTGSATITVTNPTDDYSFNWSNSQTDSIMTSTDPGEFFVTITDGAGCESLDTVLIDQAELLAFTSGSEATCTDDNTGLAFVDITAGTAPFSVLWDAAAGGVSTDTAFNLVPGTYSVTVSDSGNCEEIVSITVDAHPDMTLSTSATDADCNGTPDGTATVSVDGGTADFTYLWNDPNAQTTATATGLAAGLYEVTVSDANGCTAIATANVTTPSQLSIDEITSTPVTCFDGDDGTATVTVSGGTGAFTYAWSDAGAQDTDTASGLSPDSYTVTVSDEEGCQVTATTMVDNAEEILLTFDNTDVLCADDSNGSIDMTVTGGTGPYDYQWDNAETTEDLGGLSAGTFNVTVLDVNMCEATGSTAINTTAPIELTTSVVDVSCFDYSDGSVSLTVEGGQTPYEYSWSNGSVSSDLDEIPAGIYDVTVTDGNDCGVFASVEILQPDEFSATLELTQPLCAGGEDGAIAVSTIGGQPGYEYSLNGGVFITDSVFQFLASDNYTVSVSDANGCIFSTEVLLPAPEQLFLDLGEDQTVEIGDRAFLNSLTNGGTGELSIAWESPEDITLSCEDCFDPYALADNSGTLVAVLTDENDCTTTDMVTIFVNKNYKLFVPNVFTPESDGVNDMFSPDGKATTFIETMRVFDRWGDLVYEGGEFFASEPIGWDGTVGGQFVDTGVYVYVIEATFADGATVLFKGDVTVLR